MKRMLIALTSILCSSLFSQSIEISGGVLKNNFHDFGEESPYYSSSYESDYGYAIQIGIEDVKVEWMTLRFTLGLEKYGGQVNVNDTWKAGWQRTEARIDKSLISLGVFPFNFKIWRRIDLNLGFEISALLEDGYSGTNSGWITLQSDWNNDLEDKYNNFSSKLGFGLRGRIAYDFSLGGKWYLSPQYSYYFGMSGEFDQFPRSTLSMRQYFGLGIERKLN